MRLLEGIRVLDVSRLHPGPHLTMILADLGADVIKVEEPRVGDYVRKPTPYYGDSRTEGMSPMFAWLNRNKRGVCVDFREPEGREIIYALAKTCDAFIEGARPGASEKLGLGYEHLRTANPRIVYCSITAFGQDGPFAQLASHGGAVDSVTGMAVPYQISDRSYVQYRPFPHSYIWGSWLGALAVCAAMLRARGTGEGSCLDVASADATLMALGQEIFPVINDQLSGWPDPEVNVSVKYCYYKTKDERFMLLQATEQHFWVHFCEVVGRPDLATRGDWGKSRMDNAMGDMELRQALIEIFRTKTQAEWTQIFIENNIAGAPYYALGDLKDTELFRSRGMVLEKDHPSVVGKFKMTANAIKVKGDPFAVTRLAPEQGEHTKEVLAELGYGDEQFADLARRSIVRQWEGNEGG